MLSLLMDGKDEADLAGPLCLVFSHLFLSLSISLSLCLVSPCLFCLSLSASHQQIHAPLPAIRIYVCTCNGRSQRLITNHPLNSFVSQAQGENNYFGPDQLPSAVEGCKSNALMRCCKDIGIGSELWDPQFLRWFKKTHVEEVWVEHMVTKKKRTVMYKKGLVQVAYPYKLTK